MASEAEKAAAKVAEDAAKKEAAEKVAAEKAAAKVATSVADFSFAVNVVKLNRAKAFVNATTPGLKGKELEASVKSRYIALGGLLNGVKVARSGKGGKEVNVADDDGSKD